MNYAGKFDAAISLDGQGHGQGPISPAYVHVDSFSAKGHGNVPAGAVVVPDPNLLFHGEFKRAGVDLVLSNDGHEFVVHDYFKGEKRAAIASPDGAHLTGDIVSALAAHVQYAQATPGATTAQVIGHVTKLTGSATAIRNGVSIILNQGDNVEKGDVVSTGADSTLGLTFIDGTVFGLSANARMVLNEMVYDPNGSNNSSLLSLVAGTISFVAGQTAKHGDMKIDTPVATMGIRGTAVLTEINFIVPSGGGDPQPQANFQVLVEPDGTTGSYILFDKVTLLPIATVNQAGQMIQISGGNVTVSNALLSPEVQKLISDVFTLKFTDNNSNTKLTNFTDTITPDSNGFIIKTATGATAEVKFVNTVNNGNGGPDQGPTDRTRPGDRIPGAPEARSLDLSGHLTQAFSLAERDGQTNDATDLDAVSGRVTFLDFNLGDRPTVKVSLDTAAAYVYKDAGQHDVTASLSDLQKQDIAATEVQITVVPASDNTNNGSAIWTYSVPDNVFDFLAAGETLTLRYIIRVDNNFAANNETAFIPIIITITGTNDKPVITTSVPTIEFSGGTSVPGGPLSSDVPTSGTLTFRDVDLTDTHTVSVQLTSATLPGGTVPPGPLAAFQDALSASIALGNDSTGTGTGTVNWSLADLPVYLADFIPKDEVLTLVYTVTVTDSQGTTSSQTITVTITGTDSPAVVWIATDEASTDGLWSTTTNWETGTIPTVDDDVIVITDQLHGLTPTYPVTIDEVAFAKSLTMNDFGGPAPELINRNSLTISGSLNLSADSVLTNTCSGTISVGGKAEIEDTSKLLNAGTLILAGGGDIGNDVDLINSGFVHLTAGTLNLLADVANAGGTFQVDACATLVMDCASIDGGTVTIAGTLELDGASVLKNGILHHSGAVTVNGMARLDNETVTNDSTVEIKADATLTLDQQTSVDNSSGSIAVDTDGMLVLNAATIVGGILTVSGTLESRGINSVNDADITNAGTIVVTSGALTIDPAVQHSITNLGAIAVDGGALELINIVVGNACGTMTVACGASLSLTDVTINGGTLDNAGHLYGVAGFSSITAAITNTGVIEVNDGTLTLFGSLSGSGSVTIDEGATLLLEGDVAQTVTFSGDGASELQIDTAAFGGSIAGLGTTDTIDLSAIHYDLATTTATYDSQSGDLTVTDIYGHSITLRLIGDYSNAHFAGSDDGHGGTLITLNADDGVPDFADAEASPSVAVAELANVTGSSATDPSPAATGSIHFTDVDLTDRPTADVTDQSVVWTGADQSDLTALLSQDTVDAIEHGLKLSQVGNNNSGTIGWTYAIADNALDFLGEGQTVTLRSTITLDDHQGHTDTAQVTVTITGANDAPGITPAIGAQSDADLSETNVGQTIDGSLTLSDADATDHVTVAVDHVDVYLDGVLQTDPVGGLTNEVLLGYLTVPAGDVLDGTTTYTQFAWNFNSNGQAFDFLSAGQTLSLRYTIVPDDGHAPTGTGNGLVTINIAGSNEAPVIDTTGFVRVHDLDGTDTITGLKVLDSIDERTFTVSAQTDSQGQQGSSVVPSLDEGSLDDINEHLADGVTYHPGATPPDIDKVIFTVTDSLGASDTVTFIFSEGGSAPAVLTGTSGKDVIFGADASDTLIGNGGQDQFVFAPSLSQNQDPVQHTILDFNPVLDRIDLRQFDTIGSFNDLTVTQQSGDTLITLDDHQSVLLKNVVAGNLHASDFIVASHIVGGGGGVI